MAINSLIGIAIRHFVTGGMAADTIPLWMSVAYTLCISAPFGAYATSVASLEIIRALTFSVIIGGVIATSVIVLASNMDLLFMMIAVVSSVGVTSYMMHMGRSIQSSDTR